MRNLATIAYSMLKFASIRLPRNPRSIAKKSDADVNMSAPLIREATKWPTGHKQAREKARNLRKMQTIREREALKKHV